MQKRAEKTGKARQAADTEARAPLAPSNGGGRGARGRGQIAGAEVDAIADTRPKSPKKKKIPKTKNQIADAIHSRWSPEDLVPVSDLIPYDRNARKHTEDEVDELISMIKEFGWTVPVLVDENDKLLAGHRRRMAALKLGLTHIPRKVISGLSDAQKVALVLADNKSTLNGEWDFQMLREELAFLKDADFDLSLTGFKALELSDLFGEVKDDVLDDFKEYSEDIETEHECPKCGYRFSGGKVSKKASDDEDEE